MMASFCSPSADRHATNWIRKARLHQPMPELKQSLLVVSQSQHKFYIVVSLHKLCIQPCTSSLTPCELCWFSRPCSKCLHSEPPKCICSGVHVAREFILAFCEYFSLLFASILLNEKKVNVSSHTFAYCTPISSCRKSGINLLIAVMVVCSMAFVPASFTVYLIEEKASGAKGLQLLTGVPGHLYWTASIIWDYVSG